MQNEWGYLSSDRILYAGLVGEENLSSYLFTFDSGLPPIRHCMASAGQMRVTLGGLGVTSSRSRYTHRQ